MLMVTSSLVHWKDQGEDELTPAPVVQDAHVSAASLGLGADDVDGRGTAGGT
jgi:hypothetical protein